MIDWKEVINKIRQETKEGRELEYKEEEIGVTALLYCPLKHELRKKYPGVSSSAVEIDDGFVWEKQVKSVLQKLYNGHFIEEYELTYKHNGQKVRGHLDCVVKTPSAIVGIELKSPKMLLFREVPPKEELIDGVFLIDEDNRYALHNKVYETQALIQKLILSLHFPDKEVKQYLFYKALCVKGSWSKKLYVLSPVKKSITENELKELLEKFATDKSPRFPGECEVYCEFFREGLCPGKPFSYEESTQYQELPKDVVNLLKEYRALESNMKAIEYQLKKQLKGSIQFGNKEIGWVPKKTLKLDEAKILTSLPTSELKNYFMLKWNKKEELVNKFGKNIVLEEKEERVWRL